MSKCWRCGSSIETGTICNACKTSVDGWLKAHDAEIRAEAIDEFVNALKECFNNEIPTNYHSTQPYFTLENMRILIDEVAKEQKE